jgi:beta-CASP RNase J family ribonuclease
MESPLQILPLGGVGRIGMNCMLIGNRDRWVVVDCGVQFAADWEIGAEKKLIDLQAFERIAPKIESVIITHGHEDHIGGLPYILPFLEGVPVYATPFTKQLIAHRLAEFALWKADRVTTYEAGETFDAGPFEVEAIRVTHSIPDCVAVALRCPDGTILHTGDWKIDRSPMDGEQFDDGAFERLGKEGVDLLLSDSTNIQRDGWTRSETAVATSLREEIEGTKGRVVVTQFASNLHRLRALVQAADATDRKVAFAGGSLARYLRCAARVGRAPIDPGKVVAPSELSRFDPSKLIVVCTGSQGERAAALARAADGEHPHLKLHRNDKIIHSARIIPGQEGWVYSMFNALAYQGCELIAGRNTGLHASGHACKEEIRHLFNLVKPKAFIPVHGERSFLIEHGKVAQEMGVSEVLLMRNGERVAVQNQGAQTKLARLSYEEPTKYYSAAEAVGDRQEMKMGERKRLAWNGVIAVSLVIRGGDGAYKATAQIDMKAVFEADDEFGLKLRGIAERAAVAVPVGTPDRERMDAVRHSVRRFVKKQSGQKPSVMVFLNFPEVSDEG